MRIERFFSNSLNMKLGRMRVNYGEQRLIGAVEWSNIGRSFDGVIFTVHDGRYSTDIFVDNTLASLTR